LATIVILGLAFSPDFRNMVSDAVGGVVDYTVGSIAWFNNVVRPVIVRIIRRVFAGWAILLVAICLVGLYANSFWIALTIGVLFPIWFLAFIMPLAANNVPFIGPTIKLTRIIVSPVLVILTIILLIGIWSPELKGSWDRWSFSQKQTWAYNINGDASASPAETGVIKTMSEDSCVYNVANGGMMVNKAGDPWKVFRGKKVKIMNPNEKPVFINGSEGMVRVMLMNKGEDFNDGYVVYVPSRKIDWNG